MLPITVIIWLCALLFFVPVGRANSGSYLFNFNGKITNVVNRAHLVIPVDFAAIENQLSVFCSSVSVYRHLMKQKEGKYLLAYTANRFAYTANWRCGKLMDDFKATQSLWANTRTNGNINTTGQIRHKRQAAILGFGALTILTAFSQLYSMSQMMSLVKQTDERSSQTIRQLTAIESRVELNEQNIKILNQSITVFTDMLADEIATLTDVQAGQAFHVILNSLDGEITRLLLGLSDLSQHILNPTLIQPLKLVKPLNELQQALLQNDTILSVDNVFQLFQLDVSHTMLLNRTLLIYIHIPCFKREHMLNLYQLTQMPIRLDSDPPSFVLPHAPHPFLAISDSEIEFQSLSTADLASCKNMNNILYCEGNNILYRDRKHNCLMSIFKNDIPLIRTTCPWKLVGTPLVTQLNHSHFSVFIPHPLRIDVRTKCPSSHKESRLSISGLTTIALDPGCQAICDNFVFTAPSDIPLYTSVVTEVTISLAPFLDPITNMSLSFRDFADTLRAHDHPLTISEYHDLPKHRQLSSTLATAGVSSIVTTGLLVGVAAICMVASLFCCRSAWIDRLPFSESPPPTPVTAHSMAPLAGASSSYLQEPLPDASDSIPFLGPSRDGSIMASPPCGNPFSYTGGLPGTPPLGAFPAFRPLASAPLQPSPTGSLRYPRLPAAEPSPHLAPAPSLP